jgi:NitT/TauT family transport system substrate-binding protein
MDFRVKLGIAAALVVFVIGTSTALGDRPLTQPESHGRASDVLRIGFFPNINHAQAVIGAGNGDFQQALGKVRLERQVFTAGPDAALALYANSIDCAYVGPNPAINGYLKSGESLKVVAGASSAGAVFVVRNDAGIDSPDDFAGKKLASPQLGNTQDVALRHYLKQQGYDIRKIGGDPAIQPTKPSDIVTLMADKRLDGAWVPEPWGARLVREANAHIFLDERDLWDGGKFSTSLVVCRTDYIENNLQAVKILVGAHVEKTLWLEENKEEAILLFNNEVAKILRTGFDEGDLAISLTRMEFTYDPLGETVVEAADQAYSLDLLDVAPDLSKMFDLSILNEVLEEKDLAPVGL